MQLWKHTVVKLEVQRKHFEVDEATWENEATMRKDYPTLFDDIISSPYNTRDSVVLSVGGCHVLNFGPTIYSIGLFIMVIILMFYFILGQGPRCI